MQALTALTKWSSRSYTQIKDFVQTHPAYVQSYEHKARFWGYGLINYVVGGGIEKYVLDFENESLALSRSLTWLLLLAGGDRCVDEFDKAIKKVGPKVKAAKKKVTQSLYKGARLATGVAIVSFPVYYAAEAEYWYEAVIDSLVFGGLSLAKTVCMQPAEEYFLNAYPSKSRHGPAYTKKLRDFMFILGATSLLTYGVASTPSTKWLALEKLENWVESLDEVVEKEAPYLELEKK